MRSDEWQSQGNIYTGEGDVTLCAVVNQLFARLILKHEKRIQQQPIIKLIENYTGGTIPFPLNLFFLGCVFPKMAKQKIYKIDLR